MCAVALVGCNDTPEPEPQPQPQAPVVTLEKQSVEATAEGGEFTVNYTIENAKEGVELTVVNDTEWISDVVAADGVISFVVAANDVEEAREAILNVEYTGAEAQTIAVKQAAKEAPAMPTIALAVENIVWNNADLKVTPSEDLEYILGVMTKEAYSALENDEAIAAARVAEWESTAKMYQDMGYTDPWQYYMQNEQRSGEDTYNIKDDAIMNLDWDTEYVAYVFGMNDEGEQTTKVAVAEFRTVAPEPSDNTFTITIDAMTKSSVEFTIEPTTDEPYYVTIETVDVLAPYGPDKELSYEDLIKYLLPDYDSMIEQRLFAGKQTLTNSDLGKSVNGFKTYKVVVWGFENGPTTDVFMSEEFKPADPVVELSVTINIDELTYNNVKYSVLPNVNTVPYYHGLFTAAEIGEDGGVALAETLASEENFHQKLVGGVVEGDVAVEPESDYYVMVFAYDQNTASISSDIFLSELIHTPAAPAEAMAIDVEVTNLVWNGADIYVTPNNNFSYYYECQTKDKFYEKYGTAEGFYEAVVSSWKSEANSYGYAWTEVMGWYLNDGYGVADIGTLRWSTDYVFAIFGVDAEGNLLTEITLTEFRTATPQQSSNEFTITINAMTRSSVEFTVTPTNNDQYYVTVEKVGTLTGYGPDQEKSYDDLIDYLLPDYENQLTPRLFTGEQTITNSQLNKTVNGFADYQIVVWGFNNGPTTTVFMSEAFRPADPE